MIPEVEAVRMLVELYVKANRVEEALTAAKRGITVCKELGDTAAQVGPAGEGTSRWELRTPERSMPKCGARIAIVKTVQAGKLEVSNIIFSILHNHGLTIVKL